MKALTEKEKELFRNRLDMITNRLMAATGIKNKSHLGYWLFKNRERTSEMYFVQCKHQGHLNHRILIDRCVEEGIDLNQIFGKGKMTEDYDALNKKYITLEKQVTELIKQNGGLLAENKKMAEEFRQLSISSHSVMTDYLKLMNKSKK